MHRSHEVYDPWEHAHQLGLTIRYGTLTEPEHHAEYYDGEGVDGGGLMIVRHGLSYVEERCAIAHDNVHAERRDRPIPDGPRRWRREARCNRIAAERLINGEQLLAIARETGDPGAWCTALDITPTLLVAYVQAHPLPTHTLELVS